MAVDLLLQERYNRMTLFFWDQLKSFIYSIRICYFRWMKRKKRLDRNIVITLMRKNIRAVLGIVLLAFLSLVSITLHGQGGAPITTSFEEKDLELFGSLNATHDGFYSKLDRTCTSVGKQQLKQQLANPTTDIKVLVQRQQLMQWFCQHPEEHQ